MSIVIKGMEVKDVPLIPPEIEFDKDGKKTLYVDSKGKKVNKIQVQASEYKWVYDDGTEFNGKGFKALNGKPVKEFSKTNLIDKYEEVPTGDLKYFVRNELTYLLVNDKFKEVVKLMSLEQDKMFAFKYVLRGFKVYKACVVYDADLDKVFLRCFRGDLRKFDLNEETKEKEIKGVDDGVDSMDLDALEV